jgi:hypothetical protein
MERVNKDKPEGEEESSDEIKFESENEGDMSDDI